MIGISIGLALGRCLVPIAVTAIFLILARWFVPIRPASELPLSSARTSASAWEHGVSLG